MNPGCTLTSEDRIGEGAETTDGERSPGGQQHWQHDGGPRSQAFPVGKRASGTASWPLSRQDTLTGSHRFTFWVLHVLWRNFRFPPSFRCTYEVKVSKSNKWRFVCLQSSYIVTQHVFNSAQGKVELNQELLSPTFFFCFIPVALPHTKVSLRPFRHCCYLLVFGLPVGTAGSTLKLIFALNHNHCVRLKLTD